MAWWESFDGILGKLQELKTENELLKDKVKELEEICNGENFISGSDEESW